MYLRHRLSDLTYEVHLVQEVGISEYVANIPLPVSEVMPLVHPLKLWLWQNAFPQQLSGRRGHKTKHSSISFFLDTSNPLFMPTDQKKHWQDEGQNIIKPISMAQCCKVFKFLASTGSGSSYNPNIFISRSYTSFNIYDIIGHDAGLWATLYNLQLWKHGLGK